MILKGGMGWVVSVDLHVDLRDFVRIAIIKISHADGQIVLL